MIYFGPRSLREQTERLYREVAPYFRPDPTIVVGNVGLEVAGDEQNLIPLRDKLPAVETAIRDAYSHLKASSGKLGRLLPDKAFRKRVETFRRFSFWNNDTDIPALYQREIDVVVLQTMAVFDMLAVDTNCLPDSNADRSHGRYLLPHELTHREVNETTPFRQSNEKSKRNILFYLRENGAISLSDLYRAYREHCKKYSLDAVDEDKAGLPKIDSLSRSVSIQEKRLREEELKPEDREQLILDLEHQRHDLSMAQLDLDTTNEAVAYAAGWSRLPPRQVSLLYSTNRPIFFLSQNISLKLQEKEAYKRQ